MGTKFLLITACVIFILCDIKAQNTVITDDDSYTADPSAMLDVKSLTKGFLTPRMTTTQRNSISSPASGLLVYDTTEGGYYYYNGSTWVNLTSGSTTGPFWSYTSPNIYMSTSTDKLGLGTSSPLHKLHLYESVAVTDGTDGNFIDIQNTYAGYNVMSGIRFMNGTTSNTFKGGIFYQDRLSFGRGDLILANRELSDQTNVSSADARLTIKSEGSVVVNASSAIGVNDAIFAVQNPNGDTVFAVYPEGVRVWVNDDGGSKATGHRGGFAVGGFSPSKAGFTNEYLRVTPDSVRVYIDDDFTGSKATGHRGGFAVGGFSPSKGSLTNDYLFVQDDSTRLYVVGDEGFAVNNIDQLSTTEGRYMDLTPQNYFIGHHSGDAITTGLYNSFFGFETGVVATSANNNVFIGYQAGYKNTTANENNFIGYQAGYNTTTGKRNNFIGYQAGYYNTIGDRNTFVGTSAGRSNVDGQYNSLYGHYSGCNATLGNSNVIMGYYSGYNADNAHNCVSIGSGSIREAQGCSDDVVLGTGSGYYADNASNCILIGSNSGKYADNSSNSISIGTNSGYNNNAENNTFVGTESGYNNTSGTKNVFMGYRAGYNTTSGDKNISIGNNAGYSNTTGSQTICIGDSAGAANTAVFNIFIGTSSGVRNSTGVSNLFIGNQAGATNTVGGFNTYIGWYAGGVNEGDGNTFIGPLTGFGTHNGDNNVFLGYYAGNGNNGSGNVFLGYNTSISGDNHLGINNGPGTCLISGEFDTDRVGINEESPTAYLHIKQVSTGEEGLAIENDNTGGSDIWSWEVGTNDLLLFYNGSQVGSWDDATGNYVASSDRRLKKDIEFMNKPVLDDFNKLQLVSYRLNSADESSQKTIGFIAQDVEKYFPDIVYHREDGYLGLNYDDFGILSVKAIQEQQVIISDLLEKDKQKEQQINDLKNEIEKLKKMVNSK